MSDNKVVDTTHGKLTPYLGLDEVLTNYARTLNDVLADNFVGLYLSGSLAIGDFDLTSDVDFIVVIVNELTEGEVKAIQEVHNRNISQDSRWVKHLEYSFFPMKKLLKHSSPYKADGPDYSESRNLWYFDNGSKTIEKSGHDNNLVTRWTIREKGVTVLGPEPATFMDATSPNDLREEIRNTLVGWGEELLEEYSMYVNRFYQAFFVLNYCRVLQDLNEGRITSKLEGMKWAKANLDEKWITLIDYCWQERQDISISIGQPADPTIFKQSIDFVEYAVSLGKEYKIISKLI